MVTEATKQHGMSFRCNRADATEDIGTGKNGKESQTNQRFDNEPGPWKIGIAIIE
uniref:Uncharacterized protein n=1 Tax=Candidatus Kentrum sp. TUN TaxID=2126343 RepID=A0A450ZIK5_9GAMM|nr:MAG: hypothetical protein BECKTUN1418D_GA0071000_101835 [Candidatus Kentron sp. TUN]